MKPFTLPQKFAVGFAITLAVLVTVTAGVYVLLPGFHASLAPDPRVAGQSTQHLKIYDYPGEEFTFSYPEDLVISYPEDFIRSPEREIDGAKRIVLEGPTQEQGFEITIFPFDEPGPITAERILADIPDMILKNPRSFTVGLDIPALAFDSDDESIGPTHEVWFCSGGHLFQIRSPSAYGAQLEALLHTWQFK